MLFLRLVPRPPLWEDAVELADDVRELQRVRKHRQSHLIISRPLKIAVGWIRAEQTWCHQCLLLPHHQRPAPRVLQKCHWCFGSLEGSGWERGHCFWDEMNLSALVCAHLLSNKTGNNSFKTRWNSQPENNWKILILSAMTHIKFHPHTSGYYVFSLSLWEKVSFKFTEFCFISQVKCFCPSAQIPISPSSLHWTSFVKRTVGRLTGALHHHDSAFSWRHLILWYFTEKASK